MRASWCLSGKPTPIDLTAEFGDGTAGTDSRPTRRSLSPGNTTNGNFPSGARRFAGGPGFGGPAASFAPPGAAASLAPAPVPVRPVGQPTSPWAIVLINRADLPISVEQRLFR